MKLKAPVLRGFRYSHRCHSHSGRPGRDAVALGKWFPAFRMCLRSGVAWFFFDALRDYYQWPSPTGIKNLKNLNYLLKLLLFGLTMSNC